MTSTPSRRRSVRTHGHFGVPRETTIGDLAERAGVSHRAFSERLRRGTENPVLTTLTLEERDAS